MENNSKYVNATTKIASIAKIIAKVLFIIALIGGIGCLVGLTTVLPLANIQVGANGETVKEYISSATDNMNWATVLASMVFGSLSCASLAVISKMLENHFTKELERGTPFTHEGGKELMIIALAQAIAATATVSTTSIIGGILELLCNEKIVQNFTTGDSFVWAIAFLVIGVYFRAAADQLAKKKDDIVE